MFFISFAMINPAAESGKVDPKAEMPIPVTWPDSNPDDLEIYVGDPAGNIVWYNRREAGLMHLERDDRGMFKDVILFDGKEIESPLNQEIVSLRGREDGEYTVNLVHCIANSGPLAATVMVEKLTSSVKVIYYGSVALKGTGDEQTAVRFTLAGAEMENVNNRPKSLVALTSDAGPAPLANIDATTGEVLK